MRGDNDDVDTHDDHDVFRPDKIYLTFTYEWTDLVSTYTWVRKKIRSVFFFIGNHLFPTSSNRLILSKTVH